MKRLNDENDGFVSPLNDFVFAQIFGSRQNIGNTRAFLKTLLDIPEDDYDELTVKNPTLKRFFQQDKMGVVDLKLTTKSGRIIHIELQVKKVPDLRNRVLYYGTRLVGDQLKVGEDYDKLHQVISIWICNHTLLEEEKAYCNVYELRNKKGNSFTNMLKLVILELPKLPEEEGKEDAGIWPWLQFFKCKKKEDFEMLAIKHPEVKEAVICARRLSLRERWHEYWFDDHIRRLDKRMWLNEAKREAREAGLAEGKAEGLAKGKAEGKLEIARKMKSLGDSTERIHAITGLSNETIEQL